MKLKAWVLEPDTTNQILLSNWKGKDRGVLDCPLHLFVRSAANIGALAIMPNAQS